MDDPESEWEIQESSRAVSDEGKLGWLLRLGRKILVTGIVISSAPLVLPPLLAITAIGFVCSVPYGIFLVSYACTETVMSRLLPMPSPAAPLLLEYRKAFNVEEVANVDENQGGQNEVIEGGISMEREEEGLKEDTIEEVEMRIELDNKEKAELDKWNSLQEDAYQKGGVDSVVEGDEKYSSNIEKETPMEAENVKAGEELIREMMQNVESVDALRKPRKKTKLKIEKTTKEKGERSIKEGVNEQPADEIHGFFTTVVGDKKERDNVNKNTTAELKNVAVCVENDELVRESRGSLERKREKGRSLDVAEEKQGVEKAQVDAKVKLLKGNEGTIERKQKQPFIEESFGEHAVGELTGVLGSTKGSEKDSNMEETPLEVKNIPVQLVQAIDVEENAKLLMGTRFIGKNQG